MREPFPVRTGGWNSLKRPGKPGASNNFEVHIAEGKYAVTVFMFVTDNRTYGSYRSGSRSWVVRVGGPGEHPRTQHIDLEDPPTVKIQVSGA